MEIDREALLATTKAASSVMAANHSVPIFSKIWLMENHVLAFNNTSMVIHIPIDMPALGGVDGKLLAQLLDRSGEETVTIEVIDGNKARVEIGRSKATLAVMDPTDYVHQLAKVPALNGTVSMPIVEIPCEQLGEEIDLGALLNVGTLKHEQDIAFSSLTLNGKDGKLTMYASDRVSINRSILSLDNIEEPITRLVPMDFMRTLKKLWDLFGEGMLHIDPKHVLVSVEDGPTFYTAVNTSEKPIDFRAAIGRLWPSGKIDIKTLVPIPDDFWDTIKRAKLFAKSEPNLVTLIARQNELEVTAASAEGNFNEVLEFEHPPQKISVSCDDLLDAASHVDRIYLSSSGVAMFGPRKFSRFVAGRTTYSSGG